MYQNCSVHNVDHERCCTKPAALCCWEEDNSSVLYRWEEGERCVVRQSAALCRWEDEHSESIGSFWMRKNTARVGSASAKSAHRTEGNTHKRLPFLRNNFCLSSFSLSSFCCLLSSSSSFSSFSFSSFSSFSFSF